MERGRKEGPETRRKKNDKKSIFLAGFKTSPKLEIMTLIAHFFPILFVRGKEKLY